MIDPTAAPLAWLPVLLYAAAGVAARLRPALAWPLGHGSSVAAAFLAVAAIPALAPHARVMLGVIVLVGMVTLRFSQRYLDGAAHSERYVHWFLLTLAGASTVAVSPNLVVMALAWTFTSLSLHHLLTFGPPRAGAEIAAHKKFLLSRVADVAVLSGVAMLTAGAGSPMIADVLAAADALSASTQGQVALLLIAGGVILRSAQLPFHGWLIQVMEAPTPVSALLHAGIVNLGAFVLIALGPLFGQAVLAQSVLLVAGTTTAVLAALVMLTQANIKGALAWSTSAQMGFVLLECALGAYDLALLHLVAHALYKAHAFLGSGGAVQRFARRAATESRAEAPSVGAWILGSAAAVALVAAVAAISGGVLTERPASLIATAILSTALVPTLARISWSSGWRGVAGPVAVGVGLPLAYVGLHLAFATLVPALPPVAVPLALLWAVPLAFAAQLVVQAAALAAPQSRLARALYPHAVSGFHLDDVFTRLTFRIWPPTLTPARPDARHARPALAVERAA